MAIKRIDEKKTLEYAVAFHFHTSGSINFMMGNIMYQHIKTIYDEMGRRQRAKHIRGSLQLQKNEI